MGTLSRESLAERLDVMKRRPCPRASLERMGIVLNDPETWVDMIQQHTDVTLLDEYLRGFVVRVSGEEYACPCCGLSYGFSWGVVHGQGYCSCGWPGTLYHYIHDDRDDPDLICEATINGHRVCEARRGDHVPIEKIWHTVGSNESTVETALKCPSPARVPGLNGAYDTEYRAPLIAHFKMLLWAHPYTVRLRAA